MYDVTVTPLQFFDYGIADFALLKTALPLRNQEVSNNIVGFFANLRCCQTIIFL